MDFIPANESPLFRKGFRLYTWSLFKRRFKNVWIKQQYDPCPECKTLYFLNHHSWWDGLIPFLLNEFLFHQRGRALMEDKQLKKYSFFRKIGAFSVNREDRRKAITSMRYAVQSLQRVNSSLFIYPEGTITPAGRNMHFEGGLAWLYGKVSDVDFVPVGIHMHTIRFDKPELHLQVGQPVVPDKGLNHSEKTRYFEQALDNILQELRNQAGFDYSEFEKLV